MSKPTLSNNACGRLTPFVFLSIPAVARYLFPYLRDNARSGTSLAYHAGWLTFLALLAPVCLVVMLFLCAYRRPSTPLGLALAAVLTALTAWVTLYVVAWVASILGFGWSSP